MTADELSIEAGMAHQQGMGFLFQQEREDCLIPKGLLYGAMPMHRGNFQASIDELVRAGYWRDMGKAYEVLADADVLRQSLAAQWAKRGKDRRAQSRARGKKNSSAASTVDAADDATTESSPPQASNQPSTTEQQQVPEQRNGHAFTEPETGWRLMARGYDN